MPYDLKDPAYFDVAAAEKELARVTALCDGCRRCYRLCTSFDYMLDVAVDKNLRAKAARAKAEGVTRQDDWLGNADASVALAAPPHR